MPYTVQKRDDSLVLAAKSFATPEGFDFSYGEMRLFCLAQRMPHGRGDVVIAVGFGIVVVMVLVLHRLFRKAMCICAQTGGAES